MHAPTSVCTWSAAQTITINCPAYTGNGIELAYNLHEYPGRQTRFRGRLVIEPQLDLGAYFIQAVVDWVDLRVRLRRRTQFRYVQQTLRPVFLRKAWTERVSGLHDDEDNTVFNIRIHDPSRRMLELVRTVLEEKFGLEAEPQPIAFEVAVDFYPTDQTDESRRQVVGLLHRHFLPLRKAWQARGGQPRTTVEHVSVGDEGKPTKKSKKFDIGAGTHSVASPFVDGTFYVGPDGKFDSDKVGVMWRVQDKIADRRKGKVHTELGPGDRRARIEVNVRDKAFADLGIDTLTKLAAYDFTDLKAEFFAFWKATLPGDERAGPAGISLSRQRAAYWKTFAEKGVLGATQLDQRWLVQNRQQWDEMNAEERAEAWRASDYKRQAGETGNLVAYKELNQAVRKALRHPRFWA